MTKIPPAWCPTCGRELRPYEVLLGRCPRCDVALEDVLVDESTRREIES